ncbi:MAG: hypothetical protein IT320_03835 [Anaerolineae bacterium]|nr:hypothetical protein [Anaerolineae bacterium]
MPAKDKAHDSVKRALVKDGWQITAEQVRVIANERFLWIDLRAEKDDHARVILVEIKSFNENVSPPEAFANAIGKYLMYRVALRNADIEIPLFLAVPASAFQGIFSEDVGLAIVQEYRVRLLVFDPETEEIVLWSI